MPTVAERAQLLAQSRKGFEAEGSVVYAPTGFLTFGEAMDSFGGRLLEREDWDFVVFIADDMFPRPGWRLACLDCYAQGFLPAAYQVFRSEDGSWRDEQDSNVGREYSWPRCLIFLDRRALELLLPMPPLHSYSDVWVGLKLGQLGYRWRVAPGLVFEHGRGQGGETPGRRDEDELLYKRLCATEPGCSPYR